MATKAGGAYIEIRADSKKLKGDLDKSHKMVSGSTNKMQSHVTKALMRVKLAAAATAVAFGAVIIKASMLGASFEKSMKTVQAVSGATGAELDKLTTIAREMGSQTEFSASQAAESLKFLSMAGLSVKQSMEALPGMLDLATSAQMDLGEASDIVTDTLSAFGMKTKELTRLSDAFIATAQKSNTSVQMLGESFKFVAPVAAQMGYSVEQTAGYLGVLANSGIKASMAGTDLRSIMLGTGRAAKKLGIEGASLNTVLKTIHDRQLSANEVMDLFNKISVKSALVLSSQTGAAEKLTQTIHDMAGGTSKTAQIMRGGLSADIATLKSTAEEASLKMFEIFGPDLRSAVQRLTLLIRENEGAFRLLGETAAIVFRIMETGLNVVKFFTDIVKAPETSQLAKLESQRNILKGLGSDYSEIDKKITALKSTMSDTSELDRYAELLKRMRENSEALVKGTKDVNEETKSTAVIFNEAAKSFYGYAESIKTAVAAIKEFEKAQPKQDPFNVWKAIDRKTVKSMENDPEGYYQDWADKHQETVDANTEANKNYTEEQNELLKEQQDAYDHMAGNIHDIFSTLYEGLLTGQENVFDSILKSFTKMIAEMAAKASTDLVMNLVFGQSGSSGGGTNILGKLFSGLTGGGSGSIGGFNLSSLGKLFGMGGGVPAGSFGPALGIPGSMAAAGNSVYGLGFGGGGLSGTLGGGGMSSGFSWSSMLSGIGTMGVITAAGAIVTKVLGRMFSKKPSFNFMGIDKDYHGTLGPTGMEEATYMRASAAGGIESKLFNFKVNVHDLEGEGEKVRYAVIDYFDTVFTEIDKVTTTSINDVLKQFSFYGQGTKIKGDFQGSLAKVSKLVFSDMLGVLLADILPNAGTIDKIFSEVVGMEVKDYIAFPVDPSKFTGRDFENTPSKISSSGPGGHQYPQIEEAIYGDVTRTVSTMADIFNTSFFEAITPEGGSTWDSFVSFANTVKNTDKFIEKFNKRMTEFGLTSTDAYHQINFVSAAMVELDAVVENMNLDPIQVALKTMVDGFTALNDELKAANATTEELTKAQQLQNAIFAGTVKEMAAPTAAIFQQMADSVKNFVFNADQLKMQQIAGQGEKINKFFTELYDAAVLAGDPTYIAQLKAVKEGFSYVVGTLQMVEDLNLYKGHLQTIGTAKAGIAGLGNEFASAQIGQKYGVQLGTTAEQAAFVKNVMSMSTSEFISGVESHNVSVEEATQDLITMANIVKETSRAFSDIQISISATIKSLENQLGVGASSTLSGIMQEFNKTAGEAMSSDPATATAGAEKLSNLTGKAMKKALETAKNSYEYNKIWSKVLGTLKDVESSTSQTVTALEVVDPQAQLTELKTIATDTGKIDAGIAALLNEQTFKDYYDAFNIAFNNGAVFDNLNQTLISLPSALGSAFGSISLNASAGLIQALTDIAVALGIQPTYPGGTVTNPITGKTGPASVSDPSQWMPWQLEPSLAISPDNEQTILQRYGAGGYTKTEVSAFIKNFQGMSLGEKVAAYPDGDIAQLGQDINKLTSAYGYAEGGIATGPKSGYSALLHGTEAIIPMGKGNIPLTLQNDYSEGILLEIKGLRTELRNVNAVNSLKIKKIKQTLDKVSDGGTTFAVETK